jgi:hypothetical protein
VLVCLPRVECPCWLCLACDSIALQMSASYEAFGDLEQTMHATGGGLHFSQVPHLLKPALGLHLCLATRVVGWHTHLEAQRSGKQQS